MIHCAGSCYISRGNFDRTKICGVSEFRGHAMAEIQGLWLSRVWLVARTLVHSQGLSLLPSLSINHTSHSTIPFIMGIAPTWFMGVMGGSLCRANELNRPSGPNVNSLSSRWASFPFSRFFVKQMDLAHTLDILSSKRFRACTDSQKSVNKWGARWKKIKQNEWKMEESDHSKNFDYMEEITPIFSHIE